MRVKAAGRQPFGSAGADSVAIPVAAAQEHCLPHLPLGPRLSALEHAAFSQGQGAAADWAGSQICS